jgi:hypothetical protein
LHAFGLICFFFCSPKLFYDGILPLLVDRGPLRGFKPAGQAREQLTAGAIPTHSSNIADALVAPRAESTAPAVSATQLPLGVFSCQPMHTSNGSASDNMPDTPAQLLQALANTQDGEFQTPQRAGTCYYRCILAAFNVMLKRRGLDSIAPRHTLYIRIHEPSCTLSCFAVDKWCTVLQRKQARLAIKVAYLRRVHRDLLNRTTALEFNSSDAFMIKTACGQVGSAGIKLNKRAPSESSILFETEILCNQIFRQIDTLRNRMAGFTSDLKAIGAFDNDKITQFHGWELFLNQKIADSKQVNTGIALLFNTQHN